MRIIAGNLRGKKLFCSPGKKVRPTADRLREAIFNILAFKVADKTVLDLFSGTGAFGIEALSRGATTAVFVDNAGAALGVIRRNLQACALEKQAQVIRWDIEKNLNCLKFRPLKFDLVFMDPPYNRDIVRKALLNLHLVNCLSPDGSVVLEHSASEPVPENLTGFALADRRQYGKTLVSFLTAVL